MDRRIKMILKLKMKEWKKEVNKNEFEIRNEKMKKKVNKNEFEIENEKMKK